MVRYTVYDNRTDTPIVTDETAERCAEVMGVKLNTFYRAVNRTEGGRWTILKHEYKREPKVKNLTAVAVNELPRKIKISHLADMLGTSSYLACKFCEKRGISVISVGKHKTRIVLKDEFLRKMGGNPIVKSECPFLQNDDGLRLGCEIGNLKFPDSISRDRVVLDHCTGNYKRCMFYKILQNYYERNYESNQN